MWIFNFFKNLQTILDEATAAWGIKVERVEMWAKIAKKCNFSLFYYPAKTPVCLSSCKELWLQKLKLPERPELRSGLETLKIFFQSSFSGDCSWGGEKSLRSSERCVRNYFWIIISSSTQIFTGIAYSGCFQGYILHVWVNSFECPHVIEFLILNLKGS